MGEKRGMKALEMWCRRVTDGYKGVQVNNMTTSWRDGLAFCAVIHHFRPDLIDFDSLNKDDIYGNNELAFRTAEQYLGIPALLDAEDMVEYEVPDRLSMLTYLSQFYQAFGGSQQGSPARSVGKRASSSSERVIVSESPPSKIPARPALPLRRDPCAKCGLPVFIAERLLVGGRTLYHRSCFRCARCQNILSLANCYETEDGQYCCETCPDEVGTKQKSVISSPSLLDDQYSAEFESVLEDSFTAYKPDTDSSSYLETFNKNVARSSFMNQLVLADDDVSSSDDSRVPSRTASSRDLSVLSRESSTRDLSVTSRASSSKDLNRNESHELISSPVNSTTQLHDSASSETVAESKDSRSYSASSEILAESEPKDNLTTSISHVSSSRVDVVLEAKPQISCSGDVPSIDVPVESSLSVNSQPVTAGVIMKDKHTDDTITKDASEEEDLSSPSSIVKLRLKMFERGDGNSSTDSTDKTKAMKTSSNRRYVLNRKDTDEDEIDNKANSAKSDLYGSDVRGMNISGDVLGDLKTIGNVNSKVQEYNRNSLKCEEFVKEDEDPSLISEVVTVVSDDKRKEDKEEFVFVDKTEEDVICTEKGGGEVPIISAMCSPEPTEESKEIMKEVIEEVNESEPPRIIAEPKESVMKNEVEDKKRHSSLKEVEYPEELNPFGDEEEGETKCVTPVVTPRAKRESLNPFGSSDEEEEEVKKEPVITPPKSATKPPRPPLPINRLKTLPNQRVVVEAPKVNLNPFWSEGDEPSSDEERSKINTSGCVEKPPVPLPRTIKPATTPEPSPRSTALGAASQFGSATSLSSMTSSSGGTATRRKKKPAPPPPSVKELFASSEPTISSSSSRASSPTPSRGHSPHATPRKRKSRPAPPPPSSTPVPGTPPWEQEKLEKDEANRNRQSLSAISNISSPSDELRPASMPPQIIPNKSTFGQWKRKKGPAPPRPVPQRRQIKAMPVHEVRRELDDIEVKQQELERQGVSLEQTIRDKFELTPNIDDSSINPDVEDLVLQLFELVNEKNELFRRQAELMYLRRQQRLEEEHADLEYQVRCLMERPESLKTDTDKAREEELIQRLVEVVERRNEIVECLEMDRLREAEEDHSIHTQLGIFAAKNKALEEKNIEKPRKSLLKSVKKEKKQKKHKEKAVIKKGSPVIDMDKDIDETENLSDQVKEKKSKKKWFL